MGYVSEDIKRAYEEIGVSRGSVVLVKSDLRFLGDFDSDSIDNLPKAHFDALAELVDLSEGTIVVPTSSTSLCNTDTLFDPDTTKSESGLFSEYVRTLPGAVRSFHPFVSYCAIGKNAHQICDDVPRHAFGPDSPKDRLLKFDPLYVSIGQAPRMTCSYIHHAEFLAGVPYRYVKEFEHPVVRDGKVSKEFFYMYVWYRDIGVESNVNRNLFKFYYEQGYTTKQAVLGRGSVWGYSARDFFKCAMVFLKKDIYGWLDKPLKKKPFAHEEGPGSQRSLNKRLYD